MATILRTDSERGAGFARICLEVGTTPLPSLPEGCAFTLQRASDALFLAHSGWQESQTELTPDALIRHDTTLELCVGPLVVDNLDILNTYRIHLRHTTLPPSVIHIETLDYSPLKGKAGLHVPQADPAAAAPAPPAEVPVEAAPEKSVAEEAMPEQENQASPLTMGTDAPPKSTGPNPAIWSISILLLIAAAGGGWYWYQQKAATPVAQETQQQSAPTASSPPAETPAAPKADNAAPPALSPMAQARQQLQANGDGAQSLALAQQLQAKLSAAKDAEPAAQNQHADAIFLLVEDAAQKGQGEAMIILARYFDPVDKAPKGSIQSDPQQALLWYTKARAAGQNAAADSGISALRQWATTAATGDKAAQELLRSPGLK